MHSLAIEAQRLGWKVSGSDDEIYEPSKSKLAAAGLLPTMQGWDVSRVTPDIDLVILGMHAKRDNPELLRAQELGLSIVSYPEFIYKLAADMQRVVVAGSHGKTTITAMIMHVLRVNKKSFNYLIGASIDGFENSMRLDPEAPVIIIEGDEYFASCLVEKPKFLSYQHHIGVVSGIAWDHINVFPTLNSYVRQFDHFADASPKGGALIFNDDDPIVSVICNKERPDVTPIPYKAHPSTTRNGKTYLLTSTEEQVEIPFFGEHNMFNTNAAKEVTALLGIQPDEFYTAISTFQGAAKRLEVVKAIQHTVYRDFAHAPSKVKASVQAVAGNHPEERKAGILELHTFSSLDPQFVSQYAGSLDNLDVAAIYLDAEVLAKKGNGLETQQVIDAFQRPGLTVLSSASDLKDFYLSHADVPVWVWMSSGRLGGLDVASLYAHA